jgi:hypothetical protein
LSDVSTLENNLSSTIGINSGDSWTPGVLYRPAGMMVVASLTGPGKDGF